MYTVDYCFPPTFPHVQSVATTTNEYAHTHCNVYIRFQVFFFLSQLTTNCVACGLQQTFEMTSFLIALTTSLWKPSID